MDNFDFDFDAKVPGIAKGTVPPPMVEKMISDDESTDEAVTRKGQTELRRFIITTVVASVAAVASIVSAVAAIIA